MVAGKPGELDRAITQGGRASVVANSMTCSSSCARSNPARPLLGLFVRSLSIWRSAASTRSRARSRSATVYCRGSGRVRFLRGPFEAFLARTAALSCFAVAIGPFRFSERILSIKPGATAVVCEPLMVFDSVTMPAATQSIIDTRRHQMFLAVESMNKTVEELPG